MKNKLNPKVDLYLSKPGLSGNRREEIELLRMVMLDCGLTEDFKWGKPCYTLQSHLDTKRESNVVVIQSFKKYLAILFFKGVLLKDTHGMLEKTGVNTRVGRQIRFTNIKEIIEKEPLVKAYIHQAIAVEKAGIKVPAKKTTELILPIEFQNMLNKKPALKTAFKALTPGRQRAYHIYFSAPKQSKTRESRIEKCIPRIMNGKGLTD